MNIKAKEINEKNFKKFGDVVMGHSGKPTSQGADYKFWSNIMDFKIDEETEVGICSVYKQPENIISGMERHLRTPEILIPIDAPFVLPLLMDGDDPLKTEAFKVGIGQAVKINNAIWHGACLPSEKNEASYFVIFRKGTPHEDVEKRELSPIKIEE